MNIPRTGLVILGLLGLLDVAGAAVAFTDNAPPLVVSLVGLGVGITTLAAVPGAWRGQVVAVRTVVAAQLLSAVMSLVIFFAPDVPAWAYVAVVGFFMLTVGAVAMVRGLARVEVRTT